MQAAVAAVQAVVKFIQRIRYPDRNYTQTAGKVSVLTAAADAIAVAVAARTVDYMPARRLGWGGRHPARFVRDVGRPANRLRC